MPTPFMESFKHDTMAIAGSDNQKAVLKSNHEMIVVILLESSVVDKFLVNMLHYCRFIFRMQI
jgi:hypothetical protein